MIAGLFKFGRWSFVLVVVVLLVLALISAGLLYSQAGLTFTLWAAQKALPQLTIEDANGRLGQAFTLNNIRYVDETSAIDFSAKQLSLSLDGYCFLQPALCIESLKADGIALTVSDVVLEGPVQPDEPTEPDTSVRAPLPIRIDLFQFNDVSLDIFGNKVQWQELSSGLTFRRNRLDISPTVWRKVSLTLLSESSDPQNDVSIQRSVPQEISATQVNLVDEKKVIAESNVVAISNRSTPADTEVAEPLVKVDSVADLLPDVLIPMDIELSQFDLYDFTLEQAVPVKVDQLSFNATAAGHDVALNKIVIKTPDVNVWSQAHAKLHGDYPIDLTLLAKAKLEQAKGQKLEVKVSGSVKNIDVKATLSSLAQGQLSAKLHPLEPDFRFSVTLKDLKGSWPLLGESDYQFNLPLLKSKGTLKQYSVNAQGLFSGRDIPALDLVLNGNGSADQIDLSTVTLKALGGEVAGNIQADWLDAFNIKSDLQLSKIQPQLQWPEVKGNLSGKIVSDVTVPEQGPWVVNVPTLSVKGLLQGYPLDVEGAMAVSGADNAVGIDVTTSGVTIAHGQNRISAKGTLNNEWRMSLKVNAPDLAKSVAAASGSIFGNISLDGKFAAPKVSVDLTADKLAWQKQIQLKRLTVKGDVKPAIKGKKYIPSVDFDLTASDFNYDGQRVEEVNATVTGALDRHQVTLDVTSDITNLHLIMDGAIKDINRPIWKGAISQWSIASLNSFWALQQPITVVADIDRQQANIGAHCWKQKNSLICLDKPAKVSSRNADAQFSIKKLDFSDFKSLLPDETTLKGTADAQGAVVWALGKAPQVSLDVKLASGQLTQQFTKPVIIGWDRASLVAKLIGNRLTSALNIDIKDNGNIRADVEIPDVTVADKFILGSLQLNKINFDVLQPMVGEYSELGAILNSKLKFNGPIMHPLVMGNLAISKMKLQGEVSPVDITAGDLEITFSGYQAKLQAKVTTTDGDLNMEGDADWSQMDHWMVNSHLFADSLLVEVPPMARIKASPDMRLELTPEVARVTGNISLPWGRIVVDELPQTAVSISDDQILLDTNLKPFSEKESVPFNMETNVAINIGPDFQLRAFGLKGELKGVLNVSQRESSPFISGDVSILNGTYRSFGQDLVIQKGKIMMNGSVNKPYVSITAIRNPDNIEDDVTAGIKVKGPVDNPSVSVFSDPSMAQANALSYLLRGQNLDAESDNNSMTTSLIGLSLAQSGKLVGAIGEAFGVKDLQLDTNGAGDDSQVTVSGYVLPGLQVKYGVGIFNSLGEFTVRYRLMKDLYVEAVSGVTSAVDLLYQFEFD
jgi:translocation and assembly module TamB